MACYLPPAVWELKQRCGVLAWPPVPVCCRNDSGCDPAVLTVLLAGLFTKVTTVNELSVDTSRGEILEIHVSEWVAEYVLSG